jgi:hypothetical protein
MLRRTYNAWRQRKFVQNAVTAVELGGAMGEEAGTKKNMDMEAHIPTCRIFVTSMN